MPSAVLTIDTRTFDANLKKSTDELKRVEVSAKGVEGQLSRMASKFSGAALERDLKLAAAAVEKVGGASKLATRDQDALLKKTQELTAQYAALGKTAPESIARLHAELSKANTEAGKAGGAFASIGDGLGKAFAGTGAGALLAGGVAGAVAAVGTAAIGAAVKVVSLAVDGIGYLVTRSGEIAQVKNAFVGLAGGVAQADAIITKARGATKGVVADFDLTLAASKALTLGLPITADEFGKLTGSAVALGRAMNVGPKQAINDLIEGLGKGSAEVLNNLGIIVRADDAYVSYAAKIGKSKDALTGKEKQLAVYEAGLAAATAKVDAMGASSLTLVDRLGQIRTAIDNVVDALAEGIAKAPGLAAGLGAIADGMVAAFGPDKSALVKAVAGWVDTAALSVVILAERVVEFGSTWVKVVSFGVGQSELWRAGFALLVADVAGGIAKLLELASVLPGVGSGYAASAKDARAMQLAMSGVAKEAGASAVAWLKQAAGADGVTKTLDALGAGLADVRERMMAAMAASALQGDALAAITPKANAAGEAVAGKGKKDKEAEKAAREHAKALEEQAEALRKLAGVDVIENAAKLVANLKQLNAIGLTISPAQAAAAIETIRAGLEAAEAQGIEVDQSWRVLIETLGHVAREHDRTAGAAKRSADIQTAGAAEVQAAYRRIATAQREADNLAELNAAAPAWRGVVKVMQDYRAAVANVSTGQTFINKQLEALGSNITPELRRQIEAVGARLDEMAARELPLIAEKFGEAYEAAILGNTELRTQLLHTLDLLAAISPAAAAAAAEIRAMYPPDAKKPKPEKEADAWQSALHRMSQAVAAFAEIAGDSFGGVLKAIGETIALMEIASQGAENIQAGMKQGGIAGGAQVALGAVQAGGALAQATDVAGRGNRAARGAAVGASIGANPALVAATGGMSILVGAAAGALVGALRNPGFEQEMKRISKDFGVNISEELARAIDKNKKAFGGDRQAAEIAALPEIIAEGGGVKDENVDKLTARLRDVFVMLEQGKFTADQARKTLEASFPAFAAHVEQSGKVASASFVELLDLNKRFGLESKEIGAFVQSQAGRMGAALQGMIAPAVKQLENLEAAREEALGKITGTDDASQGKREALKADYGTKIGAAGEAARPELERFARMTAAGFNAAIKQGGDVLTTIDQFGPALDQASAVMQKFGIDTANTAIAGIAGFREKIQVNRELVESTAALNEYMLAASNLGALNADTFGDAQAQLVGQIEAMRAAGFSDQEAFTLAKGALETVVDAAGRLKLPVDEATQAILDQAVASGVLEEKQASVTDVMREGLGAIIQALGGELPAAWQAAAAAATAAAEESRTALEDTGAATTETADVIEEETRIAFEQMAIQAKEAADDAGLELKGLTNDELRKFADRVGDDRIWSSFRSNAERAADDIGRALDEIPREIDVTVRTSTDTPEVPGFAGGSRGVKDFGSGTLAVLHGREIVQTESQFLARERAINYLALARGAGGGAGSLQPITVVVELDSGVLVEGILPAFGGRLAVRGLA